MKKSSEKSFGILFGLVFLIISFWPLLSSANIRLWALIIATIFFIIAFIKPIILVPLNRSWIKFGEILGMIIAPAVMALVYFLILTPVSLAVRFFGKDLLGLKFSKKKINILDKKRKKSKYYEKTVLV